MDNSEESIVVMLVGNKVDKPDKQVTSEVGAEFARENGWGFMEVSAKTDLNIKSAFSTLVNNIYAVATQGTEADGSGSLAVSKPGQTREPSSSIALHSK